MKHYVFLVKDKKLGAFGVPFFKTEDAEHVTEMTARSLARVPDNDRAYAADQALYYAGTFDDISGQFELLSDPEKLLDYENYVPHVEG